MSAPAIVIAVMAKAPVPGLAKTRLVPTLGAEGAALLAEQLLRHAVAQAVAAGLGPVTLWCTPDAGHAAFVGLQRSHGLALAVQAGTDLGQRMAHIFAAAQPLRGAAAAADPGPAVLLMGTDLPGLTAATLQAAAAALAAGADAAFVPALDGGYGLVGLAATAIRRPGALDALFADMRWSTPQVMADTRLRLHAAGLRHAELPPVADIDTPDDLRHLPPGCSLNTPAST
jgi:rSAM/selenodomain-associated transferase 1